MTHLLGTLLIVAGIATSLLAAGGYALTIRGNRTALTYGRVGVFGALATASAVWLILLWLFLSHRFDIEYVSQYSDRSLSTFYLVAATWAGQPGSFAVWVLFAAITSALLVGRTRHFEPYVLLFLMLLQAGLIALMLVSNPFKPLIDPTTGMVPATPPADGQGLNPLLHNFWMILHPPVLFVGYALAAVPFAFALGSLLRYDYDGWVTRALPWTLAAWALLGLALFLGAYWAYETLGWGGYWGWDPVENSSLVPWLLLTALLHSMLVQRNHGSLRHTNIVLAVLTYLSVFYATYLTRSGVLTNFSVHSFVAEGLNEAMLLFMAVLIVGSVVLLAMRWRDMPSMPLSPNFFSLDSFLLLAVVSLLVIAVVVSIGTSMPVISAIPGVGHSLQNAFGAVFEIDDGSMLGGVPLEDGRFSLAPSFYNITTPPLGVVMIVLLIVAPLLGWRDTNTAQMARTMLWPGVVAIAATIAAVALGVRHTISVAYIALGVFALGTNLLVIARNLRRGWWLRIGGRLSHVGLILMIFGIIGSSIYDTPDERVIMSQGEPVSIYGHEFLFQAWESTEDEKGYLDITVKHGGTSFSAQPQLYFSGIMNATMQTPAIKTYPLYDLYIAPVEFVREDNPNQPVIAQGQTQTIGPYEITFDGFEVDEHEFSETGVAEVGARLLVGYEGSETTVVPSINLSEESDDPDNPFVSNPVALPGGHTITLDMFDPSQRLVVLTVEGLDLPVQPSQAVVTVSKKPLVLLVWFGMLVGVLGGLLAMLLRASESQQMLRERALAERATAAASEL